MKCNASCVSLKFGVTSWRTISRILQLNGIRLRIMKSFVFNIQHSVTTFELVPSGFVVYSTSGYPYPISCNTAIVFNVQTNNKNSSINLVNINLFTGEYTKLQCESSLMILGKDATIFFIFAVKCISFIFFTSSFMSSIRFVISPLEYTAT